MQCGAEVSDHFDAWMALGAAVIAAVIALAGVGLAALLEKRREAARRQHEDEVRFHEERLSAYVAYMAVTSALFSAAAVWAKKGIMTDGGAMVYASDKLAPYNAAFWRASMLAKEPLRWHLRDVHNFVEQVSIEDLRPGVVGAIAEQSLAARAAFASAAKKELGID